MLGLHPNGLTEYNNGSLLQALKREQNLTPLDDQPYAGQLDQTFLDSTKGTDGKL
jgi:raffinose/stachyose/melibiose transport system substrate-binding protein